MRNSRGFTFIETLIVVAILIILVSLVMVRFRFFQKESDLSSSVEEIISALKLAQNKTLASEEASQYGVYFDDTTSPHQYTLFKGTIYNDALRDSSFDEIHKLPSSVEIYEINLAGGNEVVFNRVNGTTNQFGSLSLRLKDDPSKFRKISIQSSGHITLEEISPTDTDRIKDSRHLHFDYARSITTSTEILTLKFDSITKDIVIADNIKDGQIYWEGEVDVNGEIQKLKIHTHRLNNSDTQFCFHRDRRYNSKALIIKISGDISGNLIEYSADGLTTTSSSNVSNLKWQ